jgi:hypothetical protein
MSKLVFVGVVGAMLLCGVIQAQGMGGGGEGVASNPDPGLVGWWKLDDGDAGLAVDSSGWDHHGVMHGQPKWVSGHLGGALQFDGRDDYVATSYAEDLLQWTVSVWVQSPAAPASVPASGPVHREANYQLNWNHTNAKFRGTAALRIGDTWHAASFGPLSGNIWYHLAATFDGMTLKAYVNGVLIATDATAQGVPFVERNPLTLGRHAGAEQFFAGIIDDVQIYDGALTEEMIRKSMQGIQVTAGDPQPADGVSMTLREATALSWSAGDSAVMHDVYLGMDEEGVKAADQTSPLYWGRQSDTYFAPAGLLESGGQYFWRIDEVERDGTTIHKGPVWRFTVLGSILVDDFERYTDQEGRRISETWGDGWVNGTGAQVGHLVAPFAERTIIHGGRQSMPLSYDNSHSPFYSETTREFAAAQDWTADQAKTLSLWLRGDVVSFVETAPGAITMSAAGTDIWANSDEFRYAYKPLNGDGAIVARIDSLGNTDPWAKAGVMIRETLDRDSAHAFMLVTPDGRRAFQNRPNNHSGTCLSAHSSRGAVSLPCWVKLERKGNQFTGSYSVDGINWVQQPDNENTEANRSPNPQTINMPASVYIGLALTGHADTAATAAFSEIATTGRIFGQWQTASIGVEQPGNSPDDLYVVVADSRGIAAVVTNPDPRAVNALEWTEWQIPLTSLAGVHLSSVKKMSIGVGSRQMPVPGGTGRIYIDDIHLAK